MIFVAVGNSTQNFMRLLNAVDQLAGSGIFDDENVFIQSGNNPDFQPRFCKHIPFLSMEEFARYINDASIIISHAGAGTLIHILQNRKIPVIMPRRKMYGEHIDDHQSELLNALVKEKRIIAAPEPEDLPRAIIAARRQQTTSIPRKNNFMFDIVQKAIRELTDNI